MLISRVSKYDERYVLRALELQLVISNGAKMKNPRFEASLANLVFYVTAVGPILHSPAPRM